MAGLGVSIIIPSVNEPERVENCLVALASQTVPPDEVVVVVSGGLNSGAMQLLAERFSHMSLKFVKRQPPCFPGGARNTGVSQSSGELVGFLDIETLPSRSWLEESVALLNSNSQLDIVFGSTLFLGNRWLSLVARDVIFGRVPHKSVPGTVIRRSRFAKTGGFLEYARCGEDAVWFQKISRLGLETVQRKSPTTEYIGLADISFADLLRKWWCRYLQSGKLAVYYYQQVASVILLSVFALFIAYNWNNVMSDWSETSVFYLPHVSKVVLCSLCFSYLVIRGAIIPISRGVPRLEVWPSRWMVMGGIALALDLVKALALTVSFVEAKIRGTS